MTGGKITEADLEYLRNIDTRPGPNAGKAIDKSLPPFEAPIPSSADVIEGMREARFLPGLEHAIWVLACDGRLPNETIEAILSAEIERIEAALALPDSKPDNQGGA